jgi:hypothetical protein
MNDFEDQAFSPSFDMAPPPPLPLSCQPAVPFSHSSFASPVELTEGEGVREEPNHMTARKPGRL